MGIISYRQWFVQDVKYNDPRCSLLLNMDFLNYYYFLEIGYEMLAGCGRLFMLWSVLIANAVVMDTVAMPFIWMAE